MLFPAELNNRKTITAQGSSSNSNKTTDTPAAILIVSVLRIFKDKSVLYNEVDESSLKNRNLTNKCFQSYRVACGSIQIKIYRNVIFLFVSESRVALWSIRPKLFHF